MQQSNLKSRNGMKALSGIITFIIVLGLIFTGFWFYQAHHIKELVNYHLKEYEKPNAEGYHLKVEDVSVGGYPFNYEVSLKRPHFAQATEAQSESQAKILVDGDIKFGTDIFGRSYWIKQAGDFNFIPEANENGNTKYIVQSNSEWKVDVAHPQYAQAFMHPFFGLPKVFYKETPTFQEILNELKKADYTDHDFALYEVNADGEKQQLLGFSKGWLGWMHGPKSKEDEKFVFNLNVKDFEATDGGKALLPHLQKLMEIDTSDAANLPYLLGSGKNSLDLNFEATLPKNFDSENFLTYKNIGIALNKFELQNLYGNSTAQFDINLKEEDKDSRNLHFELNADSIITDKGSAAIHRQFIDGLKQQANVQPEDPDNKVLVDLLKCCEDRLEDIIPDYTHLGKMQFNFNSDMKIKNVGGNFGLDKLLVNHLNLLTKPYGINSHGKAEFINDKLSGKYEIEWINYKDMIHALVAYYNRIHPIIEKFSQAKNQPVPVGVINEIQEKEIIDFFTSISNDHTSEHPTLHITIDFSDMNDIKIGNNSLDQVKEAWNKLVSDIAKPAASQAKAAEAPTPQEKDIAPVK